MFVIIIFKPMRKPFIILFLFVVTALLLINGSDVQTGSYNFDFRSCSLNSDPLFFSQSNQILKSNNSSEDINLYLSKGECLIQTNSKSKSTDTFYLLDFPLEKFYKFFSSQPPLTSFRASTSNRAPPAFC